MAERFHVELNQQAESEGLWAKPRAEAMPRILAVYGDLARQAASVRLLHNSHVDRDDYESAAMAALWRAAERFDPTMGAVFSTYATWRINGALIDVERDADWIPSKARAREKNGEIGPLPALMPLDELGDAYESPAPGSRRRDSIEQLDALLDRSDPMAADILRLAMSLDLDLVELGETWAGADFEYGIRLYERAQQAVLTGGEFSIPAVPLPSLSPEADHAISVERGAIARQHIRDGVSTLSDLCKRTRWLPHHAVRAIEAAGDIEIWQRQEKGRKLLRLKANRRRSHRELALAGC